MSTTRFFLIALSLMGVARPDAFAQPTRPVRAEVTAATVFRDRAQLTATAHAIAERGSTEIIVAGLPAGLDPTTVQVSATTADSAAALTLLGVELRADYTSGGIPRAFAALEDSLRGYETHVRALTDQKEILQKEETALAAAISQGKVDADELDDAADVFRTRATAIRGLIQRADSRLTRLNLAVNRWKRQVQTYQGPRTAPPVQLVLTLSAEQRSGVDLTVTYVTSGVSWKPVYDLRASTRTPGLPVQLTYKAAVQQSTGADWRNVHLTLSGGAPAVMNSSGLDELKPLDLGLSDTRGEQEMSRSLANLPGVASSDDTGALNLKGSRSSQTVYYVNGVKQMGVYAESPQTSVNRDGAAIRFELTNPFSIPADGREHTVEIQRAELPAKYAVTVVPKLNETAFLTATITGWEQYNLLLGRANTYLDGTFTGAVQIDPARTTDTLRLTLGPDRNVVVRREKSRDFSKRALFGGNVTDAVSYIITAKNLRSQPTDLRIEEQVPRPADSRVSVTTTELSGGRLDEPTGRLVWQARLQPGETRAWKLAYEIKYPRKVGLAIE